jgi:hypothetical protein
MECVNVGEHVAAYGASSPGVVQHVFGVKRSGGGELYGVGCRVGCGIGVGVWRIKQGYFEEADIGAFYRLGGAGEEDQSGAIV